MKKSLKQTLKENMRRFGTKNLQELGGTLQQADASGEGNWETIVNRLSYYMNDGNQRSNQIFGWWLEAYSAMADRLAYMAEQIKKGHQIAEYQPDILKIIAATSECIKKFQTVTPDIYKEFIAEENDYLIEMINDDLIGELKDLLKVPNKLKSYEIGETLETIANNYQEMSESLLHVSWDLAHDSTDPDDTNINKYSQN